jgi:hypothetical protein
VLVVVDRGGAGLEDNGVGYRKSTEGTGLQVGLLGLAEEVEGKAGSRLVGVVRRANCALKPLER